MNRAALVPSLMRNPRNPRKGLQENPPTTLLRNHLLGPDESGPIAGTIRRNEVRRTNHPVIRINIKGRGLELSIMRVGSGKKYFCFQILKDCLSSLNGPG